MIARVAALALLLAACGNAEPLVREEPSSPTSTPTPIATPRPHQHHPHHRHHRQRLVRAPTPVRVKIPAIGIDTSLIPLGLDAHRALELPERFDVAGWWSGGYRPGEPGPAVIAGHVDSKTGPAVFYRLRDLKRGDAIVVRRRDGSAVRYIVRTVGHYAKTAFPTKLVYGQTSRPTLRLITCSGDFDRATGHYVDNTVVFADIP